MRRERAFRRVLSWRWTEGLVLFSQFQFPLEMLNEVAQHPVVIIWVPSGYCQSHRLRQFLEQGWHDDRRVRLFVCPQCSQGSVMRLNFIQQGPHSQDITFIVNGL